jgi:UTP--glucose-1-phosphate uridylyltransferase
MNYRKPTKAIITDAGFASRYLPITKTIPKAMLPIGNRPVMQLVVEECVAAGIKHIIIVATPEGKPIYEDYFNNAVNRIRKQLASQGKSDRYESIEHVLDYPRITVIEQDPALPYGNGSPIVSAQDYIADDEAFIAIYSDDVVLGGAGCVQALIDKFEANPDSDGILGVQEVPGAEIEKYGCVKFKEGTEELERLIEKPKADEAPSRLASYGRYLLTPKVFDYLSPEFVGKDAELWTADAIDHVAGNGGKILTASADGTWYTTGDPKSYFIAHLRYVLDNEDYADAVRTYVAEN